LSAYQEANTSLLVFLLGNRKKNPANWVDF